MRLGRMLHGLPGMFVSSLVVFFSMVSRGSAMGVRGLFVKFGGALMRFVRHGDPLYHTISGDGKF